MGTVQYFYVIFRHSLSLYNSRIENNINIPCVSYYRMHKSILIPHPTYDSTKPPPFSHFRKSFPTSCENQGFTYIKIVSPIVFKIFFYSLLQPDLEGILKILRISSIQLEKMFVQQSLLAPKLFCGSMKQGLNSLPPFE